MTRVRGFTMVPLSAVRRSPELRLLLALMITAILVSIVHYVDNVVGYADYPQPATGLAPSRTLIATAWFVLTPIGVAGFWLMTRNRVGLAAVCLTAYSTSGLVGVGHYTVPGALEMPWWRHAHIVADILCGLAIFGYALWVAARTRFAPERTDGASGEVRPTASGRR